MNNTNWTIDQTVELFDICDKARKKGESLSAAFREMADKTSRSVNSVRNYYYSQAKTFELVPEVAHKLGIKRAAVERERFVPFENDEVRKLVEYVITAKGRGVSVRRAIADLAGGDQKLALRYQNKYRSVLRSHRDLVDGIVKDLADRHMPYKDPYAKSKTDNYTRLTEFIAAHGESRVDKFFELIEKLT